MGLVIIYGLVTKKIISGLSSTITYVKIREIHRRPQAKLKIPYLGVRPPRSPPGVGITFFGSKIVTLPIYFFIARIVLKFQPDRTETTKVPYMRVTSLFDLWPLVTREPLTIGPMSANLLSAHFRFTFRKISLRDLWSTSTKSDLWPRKWAWWFFTDQWLKNKFRASRVLSHMWKSETFVRRTQPE